MQGTYYPARSELICSESWSDPYRVILVNLFSFEQMLPDRSELIHSESSWSDLYRVILVILFLFF